MREGGAADVLIAGGGVAGASLARLLGRAGLSVELFERSPMPREKPCGEGLMPAGVRALERWGLADAVGGAPFQGARYRLGDLVAEARFPPDDGRAALGRGQRRVLLDRVLFEAAAATPGVRAEAGIAVERPIVEDGRVVGLVAGGREHRARLVVAADGLRSPLRRQLGLEAAPRTRRRVGLRTHFRLAEGQPLVPWVEVYVGRGYELYVTPLPDRELLVAGLAEAEELRDDGRSWFPDDRWATADRGEAADRVAGQWSEADRRTHARSVGARPDPSGATTLCATVHMNRRLVGDGPVDGRAARALARWIAEQPTLAARLVGAEQLTPPQGRAPLAAGARAGSVPGCVLLGDAAGYVDPITGGGMTQAMLTAELLADYAPRLSAGDWSAAVAFERERAAMLRDYRRLTELVLALARRPRLAEAAIRLMAATPGLFEHLVGVAGGTRRLLPLPRALGRAA